MRYTQDSIIIKYATEETGNFGSAKSVDVFFHNTKSRPPLFDVNGLSITNPFNADENGNYGFSVADGLYDIFIDYGLPSSQVILKQQIIDGEFMVGQVKTYPVEITPGQTQITLPVSPASIILVINGQVQQQTIDATAPKAYSYDRFTGTVTVSEPFKGNEEVFINYGEVVTTSNRNIDGILYYNTALEAANDSTLQEGDSVRTGGYTFFADYGASNYIVRTIESNGGEPDGKRDLLTSGGLVLVSAESTFNVVQLGGVANDISFDNSDIVIACARANNDGIARLPIGTFYYEKAILYPDDFRGILGESKEESKLYWIKTNEGDYGFRAENPNSCKLYRLERFQFRGVSFDDGQLLCKIDRIQYGKIKEVSFNAAFVLCDLNEFSFALDIENCRFGGLDNQTPVTDSIGLILRQNPNGVSINRCDFYRMDLAVEARQAFSTNFTGGCVFENCNRAFDFYNTQKLVIRGNYFENIYDAHFTFKGSSITPKVIVDDNYFVFSEIDETDAIVKVDPGATNSKQIMMSGNNFRLQNENVLRSGFIIDITDAGSPLFVFWENNDIYSNILTNVLAKAHNLDSPRFIGDIPSYTTNLSSSWAVYEDGLLDVGGPLRVYMDKQTRKPFIRQDVKYIGSSGTDSIIPFVTLPDSFKNSGVTGGAPIVTDSTVQFGVGKVRLTNDSDIQVVRGSITDLSNQTFQIDLQWDNEFNRIDPDER